jgi:hypothetical protein
LLSCRLNRLKFSNTCITLISFICHPIYVSQNFTFNIFQTVCRSLLVSASYCFALRTLYKDTVHSAATRILYTTKEHIVNDPLDLAGSDCVGSCCC